MNDIKITSEMISCSTNFSSHGNSISEVTIVVAFSMLHWCLPVGKIWIDTLFYYIMSGVLYERVVFPESLVVYARFKTITIGHISGNYNNNFSCVQNNCNNYV